MPLGHIAPAPLHNQPATSSRCRRAPSGRLTYLLPSNLARFRLDHSGSSCNGMLQAYVYLDVVPSHPTTAYQFPPLMYHALPPYLYRCPYLLTNFVLLSPSPSGYLQSICCLVSSHFSRLLILRFFLSCHLTPRFFDFLFQSLSRDHPLQAIHHLSGVS